MEKTFNFEIITDPYYEEKELTPERVKLLNKEYLGMFVDMDIILERGFYNEYVEDLISKITLLQDVLISYLAYREALRIKDIQTSEYLS